MENIQLLKQIANKDISKRDIRNTIANTYNSKSRGRSNAERKESYRQYFQAKKIAIELEKRNNEYLVLFPASDFNTNSRKYYCMGNTSAIIYSYDIAPKFKQRPVYPKPDRDTCDEKLKFHKGICMIANLEQFENNLSDLGITRIKSKNRLIFFKLTHRYTEEEIKGYIKQENYRLNKLNELIYPEVTFPTIHKHIITLKQTIPVKTVNMPKLYHQTMGIEIIQNLLRIIQSYTKLAHGYQKPHVSATKMLEYSDMMLSLITLMTEIKVWDLESSIRLSETLISLKQSINAQIINKENQNANKE